MRAPRMSFVLVLSLFYLTVPRPASAQSEHWLSSPGLLFADDLAAFPWGTNRRDPFRERIETDRHDFTQSTRTVGRHVVQIESGYTYFYKDHVEASEEPVATREHSHTTPEMLLRLGLSDDVEFRLRWTYVWQFRTAEENRDSAQDLAWSFKLATTEQQGWIPETATAIRGTVPTGGADWTLGRTLASADFIYMWELGENWSLSGSTSFLPSGLGDFTLEAAVADPVNDHFIAWAQSIALGKELTERNVLYAEWFALISHGAASDFAMHFFNMGIDHYLTDDLIIDFRVGMGLSDDADDFFSGVGGGYRF